MTYPMLESEILNRLANDEDPLDLSIEKYERLLERIKTCQYIDDDWLCWRNCPLCRIYNCSNNNGNSNNICPLEIYGNNCNRENSIWNRLRFAVYCGAYNAEDCCKDMLKRLKQIRDMEK